jgi:hypothetical protein
MKVYIKGESAINVSSPNCPSFTSGGGKAFDVLNLDPLEFLGYLTPFLRYRGKLKIIFNSANNSAQ